MTRGWTRRQALAIVTVALLGFLGAGAPVGLHLGSWIAAGLVTSAGLVVAYVTLLRADLTMLPLALAVMVAVGAVSRGLQRPFPGALVPSLLAAVLCVAIGWLWFRGLRRAAARAQAAV